MTEKNFLLLIDADDTLWESALFFQRAEEDFLNLAVSLSLSREKIIRTVHRMDVERLSVTGYGARPYIDTLRLILDEFVPVLPQWAGKAMDSIEKNLLEHPVILLPEVSETLPKLRELPVVMTVYTMGRRPHQRDKFERSGIAAAVDELKIVDVKNTEVLKEILAEKELSPDRCIVIGNSPRSDVNPALSIGARAIHLLRDRTWAAEREDFTYPGKVITVESFGETAAVVESIIENA